VTTVKNRHLDRLLQRHGDRRQYVRRVPASLADHDSRQPLNRNSSKTADLAWRESCATRSSRPTTICGPRYRRTTIPMRPRNAAPGVRYRPAAELQPKPAGRNSGKRRVGALRALRRDYFTFMATRTGGNCSQAPVSRLKGERRFRRRGRRTWITKASALDGLNDEARAILMAIIETGARASAICNLAQDHIFVDAEIPFIRIIERDDPASPRELQTRSRSRR